MKRLPPLLYVLQTADHPHLAKIGVSKHPWLRAVQFSSLTGRRFSVKDAWLPKNVHEARRIERLIKVKFKDIRAIGHECFSCTGPMLAGDIYRMLRGRSK